MKRSNLFYSVWAIFNNKQQKQLEKLKKKINITLKGPHFPIHMTIAAGFLGKEKDLINKMKSTLNRLDRFFIEIDNYDYKNTFFQSLYIKVKKNNELVLQKKIIDNLFDCQTRFFFPHISLYYGYKNYIVKKKIISNLPKLKKIIKITSLCLAINDEKKLKWKIIKKFLI